MSFVRIFSAVVIAITFSFSTQTGVRAQASPWAGTWITDHGEMNFTVDGEKLSGSFGPKGSVSGSVAGSSATINFKSKKNTGKAKLAMSDDGNSFESTGQGKKLRGWKLLEDKDNADTDTADFSGHWLSNWGNMVLEQDGDQVTGIYGSKGLSTLEGTDPNPVPL